jgi:hypothetical protein
MKITARAVDQLSVFSSYSDTSDLTLDGVSPHEHSAVFGLAFPDFFQLNSCAVTRRGFPLDLASEDGCTAHRDFL